VCPQPSVQTAPSRHPVELGRAVCGGSGRDKCQDKFCLSITQLLPTLFPMPLSSCVLFVFFYFLATPHGMPDLSSLTRDQIHTPCSGSAESSTLDCPGIPSLHVLLKNSCLIAPVSSSVTGCWTKNHLKKTNKTHEERGIGNNVGSNCVMDRQNLS